MLRVLFAGLLVLAAAPAGAQYKVSEIVAKGGQVMNAEQIRAELAGRTLAGTTETGFQIEIELRRDGTTGGMVYSPRGQASGVSGRWSVNAKNQVCGETTFLAWGHTVKRCNWYWKVGDEYYATNSRTDDEAAEKFVDCLMSGGKECDGGFSVSKRTVKK